MIKEQYYTTKDIKEMFQISERSLRRYIQTKKLETIKIGNRHKISETALEKFIESQKK